MVGKLSETKLSETWIPYRLQLSLRFSPIKLILFCGFFSLLLTGEQLISNCSTSLISQINLKTKLMENKLVCLFSEKSYHRYHIFNKKNIYKFYHCTQTRQWVLGEWWIKVPELIFAKNQLFYFGYLHSLVPRMLCSPW